MRKFILLVLTCCLVLGFSSIASAHEVEFENRTDFHWVGFYINYDGYGNSWGPDLISGSVERGESLTLDVHRTHSKLFKIKIVERKHGQFYKVIWHDVDLEDARKVIMHYNRETGTTSYRVIRD
jgi:hypothetical protein